MSMDRTQKRLRFDRADVHEIADGQCRVEVTFTLSGQTIMESANGACEGSGRLKAAASAALKAVEETVEHRFTCSLADLDHVNALGKDLIGVLVDVTFEKRETQVFGSCQIADSETDAAVKAALNATNRFFELAMRG
ncbi:MAG TPA: hypothetical protein VLE20_14100 [Blastocatellia bacterium]|nr:hypothetical protein [Blastocatellia bacterium]